MQISALIPFCTASLTSTPIPIAILIRVTGKEATIFSSTIQHHEVWNLWAISHRHQKASFIKDSADLEAATIVSYISWKVAFSTEWKSKDKLVAFHLSSGVLSMEYIVKQGFKNGFTIFVMSHNVIAAAVRKGRHSERAFFIRLQKLTALAFSANIQLLASVLGSNSLHSLLPHTKSMLRL